MKKKNYRGLTQQNQTKNNKIKNKTKKRIKNNKTSS